MCKHIYVLYHASCSDGFGAAFAAWLLFGNEAQYIAVQYGKPMPNIPTGEDIEVYLVDFSYPTAEIEQLMSSRGKVVILDHHETARTELQSMEAEHKGEPHLIRFDMTKSGAVMAWEYFFPNQPVPKFFLYLQDRDLWQWKLENSREVSDSIRSYPFEFEKWQEVSGIRAVGRHTPNEESCITTLMQEGIGIRRLTRQTVELAAKNAGWAIFQKSKEIVFQDEVGGLGPEFSIYWAAPALNCTAFISETCEQMLVLHPTAKFVVSYFDTNDGKRIWSLRSRPEFDCSIIAKHFGGGGHKQAAGFTQTLRPPTVRT